jgi:hypothetical protein
MLLHHIIPIHIFFPSSQLPIFPLYPLGAGGISKKEKIKVNFWEALKSASIQQ